MDYYINNEKQIVLVASNLRTTQLVLHHLNTKNYKLTTQEVENIYSLWKEIKNNTSKNSNIN